MLHAKSRDRHLAGMGRHDQVDAQEPVLLSAFDDLARLDKDFFVGGQILDGELVDVARLVDDDLLLLQSLLQGQEFLVFELVFTLDQEDCQVLVTEWAGQVEFAFHSWRPRRLTGGWLVLRAQPQAQHNTGNDRQESQRPTNGSIHGNYLQEVRRENRPAPSRWGSCFRGRSTSRTLR